MDLQLVFYLFALAIATLAVERIMRVFFEKRVTHFAVTTLSYLFLWFSLLFQVWWAVFLYFFALVIVSLNYKSTAMKRAAAVGGSHFVLLSLTIINNTVALFLPTNWHNDNVGFTMLLTCILIYFVAWIAFLLFKNIKISAVNLNKLWIPLIILPIGVTFIEFLHYFIDPAAISIIASLFNSLGVILIIFYLYNIISKAIEDNIKSALHSQEKEYYFTQCQLMQESVENTKSIRHDMQLHLATARDFITSNKSDEAANYLSSLINDIGKNEIYSNTKNTAFDSIINFKLCNTNQENIKLDLRLLIPPSLNIEVADIVIIIGNLLDNAIDAVSMVEEKVIKLDIEYSRECLFIQIENTFDGVVKYAEETNEKEKRIVTRKNIGEHGHGLKNIRKSIEKYNGHFDITHEGNTFSTVVLLYVDDV